MSSLSLSLAENGWLPDWVLRSGIRSRCAEILVELNKNDVEKEHYEKMKYIAGLKQEPIAIKTKEANEQHYEVPTEFFQKVLGKHLKYSSCLYHPDTKSLDEAEANMLNLYCQRANLQDGQEVLDLGCGWGSFSLFAAAKYPRSSFTALSNSKTQKVYIEGQAKERGIKNLRVITADITTFDTTDQWDRIGKSSKWSHCAVSVEMFEHMKNYEQLLNKVGSWLRADGRMFVHIFAHRYYGYHYREGEWLADNFFSGGTMPSADLFLYFQTRLQVEEWWVLPGTHYQKTSNDWLRRMDLHRSSLEPLLPPGQWGKWRLFFLACAELFGYRNGQEWVVTHYLFSKRK